MTPNLEQGECKTVLSVAFPYAAIGPCAVGGAEVICTEVERALLAYGFRSVVVAHAQSKPQGRLYGTVVPRGTIDEALRAQVAAAQQANIDRAFAESKIDLVHMHGLDFAQYRIPASVPVVVTLHLPLAWYPANIWHLPANYRFVCVSTHQGKGCPPEAQGRVSVIGNGVTLPPLSSLRNEGRFAVMLARICPEKNLHAGLDAARLAKMPVILGGEVFPYEEHQRYLEEQILPRMSSEGQAHEERGAAHADRASARFLGPVSGEQKQRLLSRSTCLLLPTLAPETSSLVAMEALAAGVPVVGMAVGAVPEIVEDGKTGFLVKPGEHATEELREALQRVDQIDRRACRRSAEERFTLERMLEAYVDLYEGLLRESASAVDSAAQKRALQDRAPAGTAQTLRAECLQQSDRFYELAEEWMRLWMFDQGATPFQHPAWLLPWWRQFGSDGVLHSFTLRAEDGRLCGFLPSYIYRSGAEAQQQLLLIGAGTTDYLDGIWGEHAADLAKATLQAVLDDGASSWDEVSLFQVRPDSPLAAAGSAFHFSQRESESCSVLDVRSGLPAKIRTNLNRYRRLAETQGGVQCTLVTEPDELATTFQDLIRLHTERWRDRGEEGVLQDPRVLAHHREALPMLQQAGLLRLFRLQHAGKIIGVLYGLADGVHVRKRRLYLYIIGFDDAYSSWSPGGILLQEACQHAAEHGFARVDLLRGGEAYKRLWGAQNERTLAFTFARAGD